jgi:hypothetical protein
VSIGEARTKGDIKPVWEALPESMVFREESWRTVSRIYIQWNGGPLPVGRCPLRITPSMDGSDEYSIC